MNVGIFIGRFQPVHNGHVSVFSHLQDRFDRIIVLVGSANRRRSVKNPFDFARRELWIRQAFNDEAHRKGLTFASDRLSVLPINDYLYNDTKWETEVFYKVYDALDGDDGAQITLVGYEKDDTSYYLRSFPQWKYEAVCKTVDADATDIRRSWFEHRLQSVGKEASLTPEHVWVDMCAMLLHPDLAGEASALLDEHDFYAKEAQRFADYPYPDTLKFLCADALLLCKGHILLIRRKFAPGKGCWALPGGFVQRDETFEQAAIRELFEETRVKVPLRVVQGSVKGSHVFDDPRRSLGIPRVTRAFLIDIEPDANGRLPKIKGADDAAEAQWVPLARARTMALYDDHGDIIDYFTGSL